MIEFIHKKNIGHYNIGHYNIEAYDIEPKAQNIIKRDTLKNPPDYSGKFVLTNPPYLARNKSSNKEIFDKYKTNDLYKCFIKELLTNSPIGGILIIPLNFWCESDNKMRKMFLKKFQVISLNIFEEQVFADTTYTVSSFEFILKKRDAEEETITVNIFPTGKTFQIFLDESTNYTFGGEIFTLKQNRDIKVDRLTRKNLDEEKYITNILVKCIDDNSKNMLGLSIVSPEERYVDRTANLSARTYATLVVKPALTEKRQKELVKRFNEFMKEKREQYHSLFLTNYRESKDIARKRISFTLVYQIVNFLISQL